MKIEVVYALARHQQVVELKVAAGTTARAAALQSGLGRWFDDLDLATVPVGVFGERVADDHVLEAGDRVELYRSLLIHPMEARRRRAEHQ